MLFRGKLPGFTGSLAGGSLAAAISAVGLAAAMLCARPAHAQTPSPEVSVVGLQAAEISFDAQRFVLQLRMNNRTDFDMPVTGLDFQIDVFGRRFLTGRSTAAFTIPHLGSATVPVEVSTTTEDLSSLMQNPRLQSGGGVPYHLTGTAQVGATGFPVPIDRRGEMPMPVILLR